MLPGQDHLENLPSACKHCGGNPRRLPPSTSHASHSPLQLPSPPGPNHMTLKRHLIWPMHFQMIALPADDHCRATHASPETDCLCIPARVQVPPCIASMTAEVGSGAEWHLLQPIRQVYCDEILELLIRQSDFMTTNIRPRLYLMLPSRCRKGGIQSGSVHDAIAVGTEFCPLQDRNTHSDLKIIVKAFWN